MKIYVAGTRGVPDIPGGVESHCQKLYPLLFKMGHEVIVANRSSYVRKDLREWSGIRLVRIYAPRIKALEAIVHTFLAVLHARLVSPDILHLHAVGPSLFVPLARLLGLKVVVTNHGPDYDRQKWGALARKILKLGEYLGGRFANEVIVISRVIAGIVSDRCNKESNLIWNGVEVRGKSHDTGFLKSIGVEPERYILAVARLVPEKGLTDLVEAYGKLDTVCRLVIAGDADHGSDYSAALKRRAAEDGRIVMPGYVTGDDLNQIFSHARLFVLPSYHEGLPIALLEAMSYGLPVLVSDIPANIEVGLEQDRYFRTGDVDNLREMMAAHLEVAVRESERAEMIDQVRRCYNWRRIAHQTLYVYEKALSRPCLGEQAVLS
ncbi:MAG: glycosyltransferase family 4 protein [Proteobacteria bacterium]|nr:glycosyltransferase family 4 protein [Pseudomonadota bacterium]MBU1736868.1 glycosyltransferase family 4 protein [Pseudomonadota bacterium]